MHKVKGSNFIATDVLKKKKKLTYLVILITTRGSSVQCGTRRDHNGQQGSIVSFGHWQKYKRKLCSQIGSCQYYKHISQCAFVGNGNPSSMGGLELETEAIIGLKLF